ncbi:hypothetical protein K456DRAFT_1919513 [Colletotrichum gloeosporioides 23]|nr:hypothetical protein K456DRAFT_1919513 [Colletotrichum gloeosporioides 23]
MHLVLTFFATVNRQQCPLLPFCYFLSLLESGQATRHLCHAMCAASVPFSRQRVRSTPFDCEAFASDARERLNSGHENALQLKVQRILSLGVLSVFETYQGRGLQAWYDITMAAASIPALRQSLTKFDAEVSQILDSVDIHLKVVSAVQSIGQIVQPFGTCSLEWPGLNDAEGNESANTLMPPRPLLQLPQLFLRSVALSRTDMTQMNPAPWSSDSSFMALKRDLDALYALHAGDLALTQETVCSVQHDEQHAGERLTTLAMFYGARILLNRVFLPVGMVPWDHAGTAECRERTASEDQTNHRHTRKEIVFPSAPEAFRKERSVACIDGARRATLLCRKILELDTCPPPFLGYVLFLAGSVFLSQLRAENDHDRRNESVNHLKVVFTVLGTMRTFFSPAHLWIDTLFRIHALRPLHESSLLLSSSVQLFNSFFTRFQDLSEPPFCPMDPAAISVIKSQSPHTSKPYDENQQRRKYVAVSGDGLDEGQRRMSETALRKEGTSSRPSPLDDYARAIENVVADLDKDEASTTTEFDYIQSLVTLADPAPAKPTSKASLSSRHGCAPHRTEPHSQYLSVIAADSQLQQDSYQASCGRQLTSDEFDAMIDEAMFPSLDDAVVNNDKDLCLDPPDETVLLWSRCLQAYDASSGWELSL